MPPEVFFALAFDGRHPQGSVVFHEAFKSGGSAGPQQRGRFPGLPASVPACLTVLAGLAIFSMPEKPASAAGSTLAGQLRELAGVLRSRAFWRYLPMTATALGGLGALLALQAAGFGWCLWQRPRGAGSS